MSEDDKYYTPEIEEFHVGFEYEQYEDYDNPLQDKEWHKLVFGLYGTDNPENMTYPGSLNIIRVKLLDREDIESLGYVYRRIVEDIYEEYTPIEYNTLPSTRNIILRNTKSSEVVCFKKLIRAFRGTIKNKSELKKVLKMIGV